MSEEAIAISIDSCSTHNAPFHLIVAQCNELAQRGGVSAALAFPAMLTIAGVHRHAVPVQNSLSRLLFMARVLIVRGGMADKRFNLDSNPSDLRRWCNASIVLSAIYGAGWGSMLFLLDTGQLAFLFMFKIASLTAVMGIMVKAFGIMLPVYISFIIPLALIISLYLFTNTPYFKQDAQVSVFFGIAVYTALLLVAARNITKLGLIAFERGFEREHALTQARDSHQREQALRQSLEDKSRKIEEANQKMSSANEQLLVLARQDVLTGAYNRRHRMQELDRNLNALKRYCIEFAVVILDIDHFKRINDTYGHQAGDLVLHGLTELMLAGLSEIDIFGRLGGEEFICILPSTSFAEAMACAERLRLCLAKTRLIGTHSKVTVSASFGVTVCTASESIDAVMKRVDDSLHEAKASGRNRVTGLKKPGAADPPDR